jgi:hypothetical protein
VLVKRFDRSVYVVFAGLCTLLVARCFVGSMRDQVAMLLASTGDTPAGFRLRELGTWSAPLDDVFIHFDFARSTARGHAFEWSEGNGYSSGGTSLLYPLLLALGYGLGFRELWLGLWAMALACVCVLVFLWAARRTFSGLPPATAYFVPPIVLAIGALDWNLFSGMEVALYLGLWGGALVAWDDLHRAARDAGGCRAWTAIRVGIWGALLVGTRPEGVTSVAVLAVAASVALVRRQGVVRGAALAALTALPGVLVVAAQMATNRWLTGDFSSAGAVAKLELFDPFMAPLAVFRAWKFYVEYQIERITEYHLADLGWVGWIWWALALLPIGPRSTRRYAVVLWGSAASWVLLVGLNGQVRWQNERYAMPALAWLLLAAALGVGVLCSSPRALGSRSRVSARLLGVTTALATLTFLLWHQRPRFRDQVWFFGRASRNILEQHVQAGLLLREEVRPEPTRVGVGDAGAVTYAADLPGLDLIGLGGYHALPFARAKRLGIPATLELLEKVPPRDRPDYLALYPGWWDAMPLWFGERIGEAVVHGNVICAGTSKVLYRADWSSLASSEGPLGLGPAERVADSLDFADLLSEKVHRFALSQGGSGQVEMKLLAHPDKSEADLWDAGRLLAPGDSLTFELTGLDKRQPVRLLFRVAPPQPTQMRLSANQQPIGVLDIEAQDQWQHVSLVVPQSLVDSRLTLRLEAQTNPLVVYHVWALNSQ